MAALAISLASRLHFCSRALNGFHNKTVIAELVLKPAGKRLEIVLLFGAPGPDKFLADRMGAHQLGNHVFRANDQGSAGIAVVLFLYRVRLPHARVAGTHQEEFAGFGQIQGRSGGPRVPARSESVKSMVRSSLSVSRTAATVAAACFSSGRARSLRQRISRRPLSGYARPRRLCWHSWPGSGCLHQNWPGARSPPKDGVSHLFGDHITAGGDRKGYTTHTKQCRPYSALRFSGVTRLS